MNVRSARLVVLLLLCASSACTAFRTDSRRTMHWLDNNLTPDSTGARAVLLPVAIPVGFGALLTDTVVMNPACAVDDAWLDTLDLLWDTDEESSLRRALFTPLAALATPVVFACDWLGRSTLPLPPRAEKR